MRGKPSKCRHNSIFTWITTCQQIIVGSVVSIIVVLSGISFLERPFNRPTVNPILVSRLPANYSAIGVHLAAGVFAGNFTNDVLSFEQKGRNRRSDGHGEVLLEV